ncbi:hypothetical protein GCM10028805_31170 [Spirosoma harenae]
MYKTYFWGANHHFIVQVGSKWSLFCHDVQLSGKTHLRNGKLTELTYNPDGLIQLIDADKERLSKLYSS